MSSELIDMISRHSQYDDELDELPKTITENGGFDTLGHKNSDLIVAASTPGFDVMSEQKDQNQAVNTATGSGWLRKSHDLGTYGASGQMNVPLAQEVTLSQPGGFAAEREQGESPIKSAREPVSMAGSPARRAEHLVVIND